MEESHSNCALVECKPYGTLRNCMVSHIFLLFDLIAHCQRYIPTLSAPILLNLASSEDMQPLLKNRFPLLSLTFDDQFYNDYCTRIKEIRAFSVLLEGLPALQNYLYVDFQVHSDTPAETAVNKILQSLCSLRDSVLELKRFTESNWYDVLDNNPRRTKAQLVLMMSEISSNRQVLDRKLPNISFDNFKTLGACEWLDDEIINYFVHKWCFGSFTLGLSTFFACKILFQDHDDSCVHAKCGVLTAEDVKKALKWCSRAEQKNLALDTKWDSVFIPINENRSHWYSAYIDFRNKYIHIYDSQASTCIVNRQKPVLERKNTNLMLVLMWLAELLGRERGLEVDFRNAPSTKWVCDPHTKVPFQPNDFDCGIHTLWHLQHVLQFREVQGAKCVSTQLRFTDNMVGKRVRLAQEILNDADV